MKFGRFIKNMYLCTRKTEKDAPVAQLVEHLTLNQGVQGSNPCGCTKSRNVGRIALPTFDFFFYCSILRGSIRFSRIFFWSA